MSKLINGIRVAVLTATQAAIVNNARANAPGKGDTKAEERKQIKREVFGVVKSKYGIPPSTRTKANTTGAHQKGYLVLHDKQGNAFGIGDDGKWTGVLVKKDALFPPPVLVVVPGPVASAPANSVGPNIGSNAKWHRLNATDVLANLSGAMGAIKVDADGQLDSLPDRHLMLNAAHTLAIVVGGNFYRKQ